MSQYCISCGAENQDGAKFCRSCGSAFGESKRNVESAPIENSIKYESKFTQIKSSFAEFYFSTQGRVGRKEFFFRGFMPLALLTVFFLFISNVLMAAESQSVQNMNYLVILLAITAGVSQVMISIKRFHDFNASGSWSILLFIPLANIIVQMVLLFKGSVNSENKYGDEIGFYEQTPMRWVLFVVQFILIIVLIVLNSFAKYINETPLQDGKERQSSVAPKMLNQDKNQDEITTISSQIYDESLIAKYPSSNEAKKVKKNLNTIVSNNNIAKDTITGLEWQDEPYTEAEQMAYEKGTNNGKVGNWEYAKQYCEDLNLGGKSDWRVPNIYELATLIDSTKNKKTYIIDGFQNKTSSDYWSSTTDERFKYYAWVVYFGIGGVGGDNKGNNLYVRCVRAGQLNFDNLALLKKEGKVKVSQGEIDFLLKSN